MAEAGSLVPLPKQDSTYRHFPIGHVVQANGPNRPTHRIHPGPVRQGVVQPVVGEPSPHPDKKGEEDRGTPGDIGIEVQVPIHVDEEGGEQGSGVEEEEGPAHDLGIDVLDDLGWRGKGGCEFMCVYIYKGKRRGKRAPPTPPTHSRGSVHGR